MIIPYIAFAVTRYFNISLKTSPLFPLSGTSRGTFVGVFLGKEQPLAWRDIGRGHKSLPPRLPTVSCVREVRARTEMSEVFPT